MAQVKSTHKQKGGSKQESLTEKMMSKDTPEPKEKKFWTADGKSAFWDQLEAAYDEGHPEGMDRLTPGREFWLTDNMEYDVKEVKGNGAFATVYRAEQRPSGRLLAIKRFTQADRLEVRTGVRDEAKILDLMRHGVSVLIGE